MNENSIFFIHICKARFVRNGQFFEHEWWRPLMLFLFYNPQLGKSE